MAQEENQPQWTTVAELLRPQGRKGELLAELLTDFPERFSAGARVFLLQSGKVLPRPYILEDHWLPQGKNAGRVVLKFAGVDSINDAELLKHNEVVVPREERIALEAGSEYISDLIGCIVLDRGARIGVVEDMEFAGEQGAGVPEMAPLLVVRGQSGDEILIPFAKAWLRKLDIGAKAIEMELPDGLVEINGRRPAPLIPAYCLHPDPSK